MSIWAQEKEVSGTVISADDTMPIPGVSIMVKGTTKGTTTDFDGNYTISVSPDAVLVFSYLGFKTREITVGEQTNIDVSLQTSTAELDEIVVVGYGTQRKKVSTAATSLVKSENLVETASIDATSALQGQTSGVNITSTSGQPGADMSVNIRGVGTAGNNKPLYVVDGVVVNNGIGYLDPASIDRIDILKDASAAAIYGARAANGVVLITTKKGKKGNINVALNSYVGFQEVYKELDLLNTREYATIMNEARVNSGYAPLFSQEEINGFDNHDWQDDLFNDGAIKQNYSVLINGGSDKATYSTGVSYYGQEGIVGSNTDQSDFDRITFNTNSTYNVIDDILKIGENFSFANTKRNGVSDGGIYSNSIRNFLNAPPTFPAYDENGEFGSTNISSDIANPLGMLYYNNFNETKTNRAVGNLFAEATYDNFTFRTTFGIDYRSSNYRSFLPIYNLSSADNNTNSSVTQRHETNMNWTFENTIQYKNTFAGVHNIDLLAGISARKNVYEFNEGKGTNLTFDDFKHAYLDNATVRQNSSVFGSRDDYAIYSYFGRLLYDYDSKYLFTATIRRDGSSNFGQNNPYAYFPSFSVGWNVDREDFFPKDSFLNTLKLRGSWGQNGNDQFEQAFVYMATIDSYNKNYHFGTGEDELPLELGASPDILANPDIKWETSEQLDLGFDARLFDKLKVTFDYYKKTTKDWLVEAPIPLFVGTGAPYINGGDIENEGLELSLGYNTDITEDLSISINGNISYNKNEVVRIANSEGIIRGETGLLFQGMDELNRVEVGQPIGYFYGLKTDGIFQNQEEIDQYSKDGQLIQPNAKPGDVRFVDLNRDGTIDQVDKTKIGDPNPDINYGFNFTLNYKAFDFSVYTYGVAGNQNVYGVRDYSRPFFNYTTDIFNRWTTEGSSNRLPRVTYGTTENKNYNSFSDLYVQDAGFFRIKTLNIGADLVKLTNSLDFFSKFRVYLTANNLFTITGYDGMDPEIGFGNSNQSWAKGIDVGYYPQPRTYMIGLNVNF
ncbi:SusC/RagA family TonB-linked outer membrane protein [Zunongwangia sp.]|uniref:SusC/RagA family TonB-linked outer membrane protein n=1 Tax=Zunongwangia sp. TaxID=1965325 RepID=UPI003AA9D23E